MDSSVALASWFSYPHFCRVSMLELPINCDSRIVCYRIALQRKCAYTRMCAFRIHKGKQLPSLALTQKESKSNVERVKRGHHERW